MIRINIGYELRDGYGCLEGEGYTFDDAILDAWNKRSSPDIDSATDLVVFGLSMRLISEFHPVKH